MHEFERRILLAVEKGVITSVCDADARISHDMECGFFAEQECDCSPYIVVMTKEGRISIDSGGSAILTTRISVKDH